MSKRPLPSVSTPTLIATLPLSKKTIKYRPFTIKEQKSLLLAQESSDKSTISETIYSVIHSCTDGTLDIKTIPVPDIGYFFLQLRIASVGSDVRFSLKCKKCDTKLLIGLNLTDVKVKTDDYNPVVRLTNDVGITFRLPTLEDAVNETDNAVDKTVQMLYTVMENIFDEEQVYTKSDYSLQEFSDWLDSLNDHQLKKIQKFVESIPELSHTLHITCHSCGEKQSRTLEGLHNFFRLSSST